MIAIIPAAVAVASGIDALQMLVLSQVVLSFQVPFATIPLIRFTKNRAIMGDLTKTNITTIAAIACVAVILFLNALLVAQVFGVKFYGG